MCGISAAGRCLLSKAGQALFTALKAVLDSNKIEEQIQAMSIVTRLSQEGSPQITISKSLLVLMFPLCRTIEEVTAIGLQRQSNNQNPRAHFNYG